MKTLVNLLLVLCVSNVAFAAITAPATAVEAAARYPDKISYSILRGGKKIGNHTVSFTLQDNNLTVDIDSKLTVTILKVPVFRFHYKCTESWQDNTLVEVQASTRSNRQLEQVSMLLNGDKARLTNSDGVQISDPIAFATNHWHIDALSSPVQFNTINGVTSNVALESLGTDQLSINAEMVTATHYRYTGDIQADVWYDTKSRWLKLEFKGADDSTITYLSNGF